MGGKNLKDINFTNINDQIKFTDTLKCHQQSLSVLASTMTDPEKPRIKNECKNFIETDQNLNKTFYACLNEDQK